MSLSKKIAKNTVSQIAGKIISTIVGVLAVAMAARYLGTSDFGRYATIVAFLSFFASLADLGLTLVTSQMISEAKIEEKNKVANNIFTIRFLSAIFIIGLAPVFINFFPYEPTIKYGVYLIFPAFILVAMHQIFIGILQTELKMGRAALSEVLSRLIVFATVFLSVVFDLGIFGILSSFLFSAITRLVLLFWFSFEFIKIKFSFDFSLWGKIIQKTWPLGITIFFNLIYLKADTLLLSLLKNQTQVGLYGAAYKIVEVLTTIPFMFAGILLPIMTKSLKAGDFNFFKKTLQKAFDFLVILAVPMVLGTQFLAKDIMILAAGPDFAESGQALRLLVLATGFIFIGSLFSHAIIALNKQTKIIWTYIFTAFTAIPLYFYLIPKLSFVGAALGTIYSELAIAIFAIFYTKKFSSFKFDFTKTKKTIFSGVFMFFVLFLSPEFKSIPLNFLFKSILAGLSYFSALYFLGGINKEDLKLLRK